MTKLANIPPLTLLLVLLAGTGLLALMLTLSPSIVWTADAATASGPTLIVIPQIEQQPYETYVSITQRPLFNPGRREDPSAASVAAAAQIPPLDSYRLVGIVLAGQVKLALVERKAIKQVVTLHTGDVLDGRRVDDINDTGVQLSGTGLVELLAIPKALKAGWSFATRRQ